MKKLLSVLVLTLALFAAPLTHASVRVYNSSGTNIGTYSDLKLSNGLSVSQVSGKAQVALTSGDGSTALAGFLQGQYSTSGDLTVASCGKTVTSDNSMGTTALFNLPAIASAMLGCRITFAVGTSNGYRMNVNPNGTNRIFGLTNAAGDSVTADDLGDTLTLEAIAPGWVPAGTAYGTWSDAN